MKKGVATAGFLLVLIGIALWLASAGFKYRPSHAPSGLESDSGVNGNPENSATAQGLRTKSAIREPDGPRATHGPQQLKDFMLPEMAIDGLSLEEALRKLNAAYQDACLKSGETPLDLKFAVAPGSSRIQRLRLRERSFSSSVRLVATLAGMTSSRSGLTFHFKPLSGEPMRVVRSIRVRPDLSQKLTELAGHTTGDRMEMSDSLGQLIRNLGLDLDPSTRLTLDASGKLSLETTRASDAAALTSLIEEINGHARLQHKVMARIIELSNETEWTAPDTSRMSDAEHESFMRGMAKRKGTMLKTLPSVTSRAGQIASIEMIREFSVPSDDSGEAFETHRVGQVMHVKASPLGFGHDLVFDFTDTVVENDPANGKPVFHNDTEVSDAGFSSDHGSRLVVQTRDDGSRSVVLVTSQLIDATGRPLRDPE